MGHEDVDAGTVECSSMFDRSASLYDSFYAWKDYRGEARRLHELIQGENPGARTLLDVACGTGRHLEYLREHYEVEGVDLDAGLLEIARQRNPGMRLHQANMVDFGLNRQFDVVTCLFSSIGYLTSREAMRRGIENMVTHLRIGGLLIVEPWFEPDDWEDGHVASLYIDQPNLKAARMNVSRSQGRLSILEFHYLVANTGGISHFTEDHSLFLFTHDEYTEAFRRCGLVVAHDEEGFEGRGLYIAHKPTTQL
jgi:SAM-dependent methyltransferase